MLNAGERMIHDTRVVRNDATGAVDLEDGQGRRLNAVTATTDAVTGDVTLSRAIQTCASAGLRPVQPRILKRFLDLANCTIAASTATVAATIDRNSPWGGAALKLVITPSGSGARVDVSLTDLNIPEFDGHVCAAVWIPDTARMSRVEAWLSGPSFTNSSSWRTTVFSGGDVVGGHRVYFGGPMHAGTKTNTGAGFVAGTDTLDSVRLRLNAVNNTAPFTVWVRDIFIPARQRPIVCFTWDDADESFVSRVRPLLDARGIKGTFGIYSSGIDVGAAYVTSAGIQALAAAGHQIACHNVNNYALQTLASHGSGEQGGATAIIASAYATEYSTARQILEGLGIDPEDFCYHPWVQGNKDTQGVALLRAAGVDLSHICVPHTTHGFQLGNNGWRCTPGH
jgi:hypothetical protein